MNRSRMLQGVITSRKKYLLDTYSGSVGAYSLRYLSSSFVGNNVVLVRRSSDDAEEGFTPTEITNGTLTSFCGAGDGFVKTWYDQSLTNHATQTTKNRQPKIVDSGSLITMSGKVSVFSDGVDDYLLAPAISGVVTGDTKISNFNVCRGLGVGDTLNENFYGFMQLAPFISSGGGRKYFWISSDSPSLTTVRLEGGNTQVDYNARNDSVLAAIYKGDQDLYDIYANGAHQSITGGSAGAMDIQSDSAILFFGFADAKTSYADDLRNFHSAYISESILYFSDESENWEAIQENQNSYYNVF